MFELDERSYVRTALAEGELFLKLLDRVSIVVGKIGWKNLFADGRQFLTKLRERESKERVVVYSITDVARQAPSVGSEDYYLNAKSP